MTRISPSNSATLFKIGTKKKGNDAKMWIVSKTSTGVKRWKKVSSPIIPKGKTYDIHDNGGRPFRVIIHNNKASIYTWSILNNSNSEVNYDKLIKKYNIKKIYIGKSTGYPYGDHSKNLKYFDGNSILLQLTQKNFVYIGSIIYEFILNDEVEKYYSMVGRNDVPYPVLLGKKNVYFMNDKEYVNRDKFPKNMKKSNWEGAYVLYYNGVWDNKQKKYITNSYDKYSQKMKNIKIIYKRL